MTDAYSQIAGAMVFVLVAVLFIMLLILNNPKYESKASADSVILTPSTSLHSIQLDDRILVRLNVAFYSIVMLFVLSFVTLIFLLRAS